MSSPENPVRFSPRRRVVSVQRSTKAGASTPATPLQVNRYASPSRPSERSTKAGASTPATRPRRTSSRITANRSTKAGASTPATLKRLVRLALPDRYAQRRPERQPRRHASDSRTGARGLRRSTKAGASTPATPQVGQVIGGGHVPLNEGRSVNPGDTRCRSISVDVSPRSGALNEGRSVNPGDTSRFASQLP